MRRSILLWPILALAAFVAAPVDGFEGEGSSLPSGGGDLGGAGERPAAPAARADRPAPAATLWRVRMGEAIGRHKIYPSVLRKTAREGGTPVPSATVVVAFALGRDGRLVEAAVLESSGIPELDAAALRMVRRADPLPPPPAEIEGDPVRIVLPVRFAAE